jgi:hypothetical protein
MKSPVKYVIQRYERFPIYGPAEGGYYYNGREPDSYAIFNTCEEANTALKKLVKETNDSYEDSDGQREGLLICYSGGKYANAESVNHRYIGDGYEFYVEPIDQRGLHRKGYEPYC